MGFSGCGVLVDSWLGPLRCSGLLDERSHLRGTLLAVSIEVGESPGPADAARRRWRLNRAGIVNVYQYEDEVLHFAGGRLLLRGVNGSGKSTAMNMLLPFLLTTREGRIDAAGEQSGILKSWMLNGRDDPQPVGYLWIEFERCGEFLVCGCGIRADRRADRVRTWWFATSKRPDIDLSLVSGNAALSAEALRAVLDGDEVFTHERRSDYRRAIEQRLFGGASIEQHIGLLNKVRSPRVGDRIDLYLRDYLVEALPGLSEQALADAAQPLDNLEEHRRNLAELDKTREAVHALLGVYRSYCVSDLHRRVTDGQNTLESRRSRTEDAERQRLAACRARSETERLTAEASELNGRTEVLRSEIEALEKSPAYRDGQQLEDLRKLVRGLSKRRDEADRRQLDRAQRSGNETGQLTRARQKGLDDAKTLNEVLARTSELARTCGLDRRIPSEVTLRERPMPGVEATEPEALDSEPLDAAVMAAQAALLRRRDDVEALDAALGAVESAERQLQSSESSLESANRAKEKASARLAEKNRGHENARSDWAQRTRLWATEALTLARQAGLDMPTTASAADRTGTTDPQSGAGSATDRGGGSGSDWHQRLLSDLNQHSELLLAEANDLVEHWHQTSAVAEQALRNHQEDEKQAQETVDELNSRNEPDPPRLDWQQQSDHCLADLIDFAPHLDDAQRGGLEAALEASGLLSARPASSLLELANGELVALRTHRATQPLSAHLTVSVPERLVGAPSEAVVAELLDSISLDLEADATAAVTFDGEFRIGSLRGRHRKQKATHIGVSARRDALETARAEAERVLQKAHDAVARGTAERSDCELSRKAALRQRSILPGTRAVDEAAAAVAVAAENLDDAFSELDAANEAMTESERVHNRASNALDREATTRSLPRTRGGADAISQELSELQSRLNDCRYELKALARSLKVWSDSAGRLRTAIQDHLDAQTALAKSDAEHRRELAKLATIEDSIGAQYKDLVADLERCRVELDELGEARQQIDRDREEALMRQVQTEAESQQAQQSEERAEQRCDDCRLSLVDALAARGYLAAICDGALPPALNHSAGAQGLKEMLDALGPLLGTEQGEVGADAVRQSLLGRRDSLGAGWDAEARQPDSEKPLIVEVTGPLGRAPLADQVSAVSQNYQQVAGLLNRKQNEALRQLLQGLVASEIATRIKNARHLIEKTNQRLGKTTTAHGIGVELRWRRSGELDPDTARMVDLLAKEPDLRSDDDESELRRVLSDRLDEARAEQPDWPYREIIAKTLDYKQWHEMDVMLTRDGKKSKLGRRTPLSEGEKKLVTYLPLFAAVAASYDTLTDQKAPRQAPEAGIARFVLLDDAFAKVSEDNHAALFGLLVDFDLDFIATSERLWGTHETVPELAVTEVIRHAEYGTILLEHYHWDGITLLRPTAE